MYAHLRQNPISIAALRTIQTTLDVITFWILYTDRLKLKILCIHVENWHINNYSSKLRIELIYVANSKYIYAFLIIRFLQKAMLKITYDLVLLQN